MGDKTTAYSIVRFDALGRPYRAKQYKNRSTSSVLPNGEIDVVSPHEHLLLDVTASVTVVPGKNGTAFPGHDTFSVIGYGRPSTRNKALAQHRKNSLGGQTASLGITAATWKESLTMINSRLMNVLNRVNLAHQLLSGDKKRREYLRRRAKRLGISEAPPNLVLEGFFGWSPLFSDLADGIRVLGSPINDGWVRGRGRVYERNTESALDLPGTNPSYIQTTSGEVVCTITSCVEITNFNLWMLNRLGLINPLVVAWDLVPWSFVVNLFFNVSQVLNSVTDQVGLKHSRMSETWRWHQTMEEVQWTNRKYPDPYEKGDLTKSSVAYRGRVRSLGGSLQPSLVATVPDVAGSISFAAIYSSLLAQRSKSLLNLLHL